MSLQTFNNRLLMDERWQTPETIKEYLQKFSPGDPILIQFTTNYDISKVVVSLCNQDGTIDQNGIFIRSILYTYSDGSGNVTYNYLLDQRNITFSGFKFVKIVNTDEAQPNTCFVSEAIEFNPNYSSLLYIQWQDSDRDGIFWDAAGTTIFGIRAELRAKYTPQLESSIFEGFSFKLETLYTVSRRGWQLNGDPIPRYIAEKLKLAFDHFNIWINGTAGNSNGATPKITPIDNSNLYDFEHLILETEYEDYAVLQEASGAVINTGEYLVDNDNVVLIDNDETILIG